MSLRLRYWYGLLDFVQWPWHAFKDSRIGDAIIFFMSRIVWVALRVVVKVLAMVFIWTFIVGVGVMLGVLKFAFSSQKKGRR